MSVVAEDPVRGWGTNLYGINGLLVSSGVGLLRVGRVNTSLKSYSICTDQVVSATMIILWEIGLKTL